MQTHSLCGTFQVPLVVIGCALDAQGILWQNFPLLSPTTFINVLHCGVPPRQSNTKALMTLVYHLQTLQYNMYIKVTQHSAQHYKNKYVL